MFKTLLLILSFVLVFVTTTTQAQLSREELNSRLEHAIQNSFSYKVILDDFLGEGPGFFDSDPRYPTNSVNCIIWLQLLLAEVYGKNLSDKTPVLDRIRYYNGQVGFSTRKHYTDQWVSIEPAPLQKVNITKCAFPYYHHVRITPEAFLKSRNYSCDLYKKNDVEFDIQYAKADGVLKCAEKLPRGNYVLFAVPTDAYSKKYLSETGPMGLVHAMVLNTKNPMKLYHASTSEKKVKEENPNSFFEHMKNLHLGYAIYELDPNWDFTKKEFPDPESRKLISCETGRKTK